MDEGEEQSPSVGSPPRVHLRLRMYAAADENLTLEELAGEEDVGMADENLTLEDLAGEEDVGMDARDEPTPETQRQSFEFAEDKFR